MEASSPLFGVGVLMIWVGVATLPAVVIAQSYLYKRSVASPFRFTALDNYFMFLSLYAGLATALCGLLWSADKLVWFYLAFFSYFLIKIWLGQDKKKPKTPSTNEPMRFGTWTQGNPLVYVGWFGLLTVATGLVTTLTGFA